MSTFSLRQQWIEIARRDVGKVEVTRNQAPWIAKLWPATTYSGGMAERQPYCAAGQAYCLREWGKVPGVLDALKMTPAQFEKWRCKSASVYKADYSWLSWAKEKKLTFIGSADNFHTGDLILYSYSHIEVYVDDSTAVSPTGFMAIGYNTDSGGSADGDGCFEKPRSRKNILRVIRILP